MTTWWAWFIYALFVIYGSLVPFDFRPLPLEQAWAVFRQTPFLTLGLESRADWIANGVLYVPLGLLGARALGASGHRIVAAFATLLITSLLAFAVEFAQIHFPPRTVSQNDLLAEVIGSMIGIIAAFGLESWLNRFSKALFDNAPRWKRFVLQAYALVFFLYCFFPFDFLISSHELQDKLESGNWGWLFASPEDANGVRIALLSVVEVLTVLPLGFALGQDRSRITAIKRGLGIGILLGLVIELGQFFIASGVSQGASVISRAAGMALGALIGAGWRHDSPNALRNWSNKHFRWLLLIYLAVLFVASWGPHPWQGWEYARQSWEGLRLLPFYYHYYTTEAAALTSLSSNIALYAPLGILAWIRMTGTTGITVLTAILALVIECGKLFMAGTHPDPTNILIAGAAVWLLKRAMTFWESGGHSPQHGETRESRPGRPAKRMLPARKQEKPPMKMGLTPREYWLPALLAYILWSAANWPAYSWLVVAVIFASAALIWWRPATILILLPAAMPTFDLAPWSGRFFVDEFDLLCTASFAICLFREKASVQWFSLRNWPSFVLLAFGVFLVIGATKGLGNAWPIDMNSFSNYHSPYNGLRILKGALWAWLFIIVYRALVTAKPERARLFHAGLASGLLLTVLVVLWERMAAVSLFDFVTEYRVTGPFSTMNKGGAYIECFLAVSAAFVTAELASSRNRIIVGLAAALLALTTYAIFVTYSRNGYAALAVALAFGILIAGRTVLRRHDFAKQLLPITGVIALGSGLLLSGGYASERLAATAQDLSIRKAHWEAALDLRDDRAITSLFGVGLGRFPEMHFWHSRGEPRAATYRLEPGNGNAFLRLGSGTPLYIEQVISPPAGKELSLTINVRSATPQIPKLNVTLCRKTLLTSDECEMAEIRGISAPGIWQTQYATLPPLPEPPHIFASFIPIKLSLMTPSEGSAIDIDNVNLRPTGTDQYLTRNGSFEKGLDHWFFATDIDPPWHIHSLPVALLFDLGWLGLATTLAILGLAFAGAWQSFKKYRIPGMAAFAGLAAFLVSGTLNTLIDEPRFLWLWLVLLWLAMWHGRNSRHTKVSAGETA